MGPCKARLSAAGGILRLAMLLALALVTAPGCTHPGRYNVRVPQGVAVPERCGVLLFVDGLDPDVFHDMAARGELPGIQQYLVRRGTIVENAFSTIPSITYANKVTFLTGLYPGHHGVLGNKWFDRTTLVWKTYNTSETYRSVDQDYTAPTIHEVLHDRFTVNFQGAARRGVDETVDNWAESGVCWFFGWHLAMDRWVGSNFQHLERLARKHGRWPAFVHAYFPGCDTRAHQAGSNSPGYRQALRNLDTEIAKVGDALDRAGVLERTYLILVSDHGHTPCPRENFVDVSKWLRRRYGWRIHERLYEGGALEERQRHFARVDAAAINGGNRQYFLHLPGPGGWFTRPAFDRCREILTFGEPPLALLPAVFVGVCKSGPNQVWIYGRDGEATVTRRGHDSECEYRYDVVSGDPLGYLADAPLAEFVRAGWHDSRSWLKATARARCPDTPPQITELFDSVRSPDIALFAADGWDFAPENVGGHGSILRRDMWVPMMFAGPGIPAGKTLPTARTCDVAPTVVELLAGPERLKELGRIDGISLVPQLMGTDSIAQRP